MMSNNKFLDRLVPIQIIAVFFAVASFIFQSWNGNLLTEKLVFRVVDGWCSTPNEGVGLHCFSDFGLPRTGGLTSETYSGFNASNTPFANLLFHPFRYLSYNIGLYIYLLILILCWIAPIASALKSQSPRVRIALLSLLSTGSMGLITVIDRGNHILLLLPPLTYYFTNFDRRSSKKLVVALFLVISIKFWGFLLVLHAVANRRYRVAVYATGLAGFVNLMLVFITPGGGMRNLRRILSVTTDSDLADGIAPFTVSLLSLFRRFECVFDSTELCSIGATSGSFFGSSLIRTTFALYLVAICIVLWNRFRTDTVTQAGIFCALVLLAVPESGFYTLVLTGSVLAVGIRNFQNAEIELRYSHIWLINCLVVSGSPIAFAGLRGADIALFDQLRFHNVAIPVSWIIYLSFLFLRPNRAESPFLHEETSVMQIYD